jgi:nitrate reductase gamma subunit
MKLFVAVVLVSVCVVVFASMALNLLTPGQPVEFLGVNIAKSDGQFIPPVAGGMVLAAGVVWLLIRSKRAQ